MPTPHASITQLTTRPACARLARACNPHVRQPKGGLHDTHDLHRGGARARRHNAGRTGTGCGAPRTFVSAAGSDSNNCTNVATPCRHLAAAYAATAADGEIYVLDPANYGSLTITGPVSIEGHGWASIAPVIDNPAITINANPGDAINIIGVVLMGPLYKHHRHPVQLRRQLKC